MIAAKLGEELRAALVADVDIEQDHVDRPGRELLPCLPDRSRLAHDPALQFQVDTAEEADAGIVVDDENGVPGRVHRAGKCTRIQAGRSAVSLLKMTNESPSQLDRELARVRSRLPRPSPQFRRRAWLSFQRAIDPLAPPKPLRGRRQH